MRPWIRLVNEGPGIVVRPDDDGCPRGIRLPQGSKEIEMTKKVKRLIRKPYQLPMSNYCRHMGTRVAEAYVYHIGLEHWWVIKSGFFALERHLPVGRAI